MPSSKGLVALVMSAFALCCCTRDVAAQGDVATCRPSSSALSDNGIGIISDTSCNVDLSIRSTACLDTQCRLCQVYRSTLSKIFRPCSLSLPLPLPVAVVGGTGTASSDTTPSPTTSTPSTLALTTPALTTPAPATPIPTPASTTLAPTTSAPTTPAPTTSAPTTPAPITPAPTTPTPTAPTPTTPAPTAPTPTTTTPYTPAPTTSAPTTPALITPAPPSVNTPSPDGQVDCIVTLNTSALEMGIYAAPDESCYSEYTEKVDEDGMSLTTCINQYCRLCAAGQTEFSAYFQQCKLFI